MDVGGSGADVGGNGLTFDIKNIGQDDLCSFAGEQSSFRLALTACCACNDDNLAVESTHDSPSCSAPLTGAPGRV